MKYALTPTSCLNVGSTWAPTLTRITWMTSYLLMLRLLIWAKAQHMEDQTFKWIFSFVETARNVNVNMRRASRRSSLLGRFPSRWITLRTHRRRWWFAQKNGSNDSPRARLWFAFYWPSRARDELHMFALWFLRNSNNRVVYNVSKTSELRFKWISYSFECDKMLGSKSL